MISARLEIFQRTPAQLGEGPCWHPRRESLWWIDIPGKTLFEADLHGGPVRKVALTQMAGSIAVASDGRFISALHRGIHLIDPVTGSLERFTEIPDHDPINFRFNDGKVDPQGRFWAGTLGLKGQRGQSRLFRIQGDRSVAVMLEHVSISNGLAWAPDERTLYYVDSPTRQVQAFDFDGNQGVIYGGRVAISLTDHEGVPDGCCMDAEGCLWLAHWGGAKLTRWNPRTAELLQTISLPVRNVTCCAFGGPKLDKLFVTTAVDPEADRPEPEAGFVFCLEPGVSGLVQSPFRLPYGDHP